VEISPGVFVFGLAISIALSLLVFSHASKHGSKHATAWGIAAFVFGAGGAAVYYARHWWRGRSGRSGNRRY
jgi:hypothetical protein